METIGGLRVAGTSRVGRGAVRGLIDPATGQVVAEISQASRVTSTMP